MKKYLLLNILLFVILVYVLWSKVISPGDNKKDFTFQQFLEKTYNLEIYPPNSIGVLYLFRNVKDNESIIRDLLADFTKYNFKSKNIYPFIYYGNNAVSKNQFGDNNIIKTGQFEKIANLLEIKKGKTVLFNISKKNIINSYNLYLNPYTTLEALNEGRNY